MAMRSSAYDRFRPCSRCSRYRYSSVVPSMRRVKRISIEDLPRMLVAQSVRRGDGFCNGCYIVALQLAKLRRTPVATVAAPWQVLPGWRHIVAYSAFVPMTASAEDATGPELVGLRNLPDQTHTVRN